jgi:pimeloyl-ACP methyl ester carboxylesterase
MFRRSLPLFVAFLVSSACACLTAPAGIFVDTGEIEGAKFTIARPAHWNHCLLLVAHGLRDGKAPLVADLNPEHLAYRTLIAEGWIVAKTSYRRNGMILRDAITDLENLRTHIEKTYGEPQRVLLEGDSMGGAIVTLMAEQSSEHYQGAVAVGAALDAREPGTPLAFNLQPQIPLVFLTNQSEIDGPRRYVTAPLERVARPVLLKVTRDGHVNVNQRERLTAIRAVLALLDRRTIALPTVDGAPVFFDATQPPAPGPSQVRLLNEGGFEARVTEVTAVFGNLALNAQPPDFGQASILPGTWFALIAKGQTYRVFYGREFNNVKRGQWVAFPNADGFFYVGRNRDHAAATAGLKEGDLIIIHRLVADPVTEPPASAP